MEKLLFASAAIACVMAFGPIASQRVDAAPVVPAAMAQTSAPSLLPIREWRDHNRRNNWPFWLQRRQRGNDYDRYEGYRGDGFRYRRDHSDRGLLSFRYRTLSDD